MASYSRYGAIYFEQEKVKLNLNLNEVQTLCRSLMDHHGLINWTFKWNNSKSAAGLCYYGKWDLDPRLSHGRIELSKAFMSAFDEEHARNTILHEIAHALTKERGHGREWKAKALSIGCTGERCVSADAPTIQSRYKIVCPAGHEFARHRNTHALKTSYCLSCARNGVRPKDAMFNIYDQGQLIHSRPTSTIDVLTHLSEAPEVAAPKEPLTAQQLSVHHSEYLQKFLRGY